MKTNLCSALFIMLVAGCATEQLDPGGPDFDDPDAKLDGASQPLGMYKVVEPSGGFGEGEPRIALLDIRSDGTVYDLEYGPVAYDDYNYGEGQTELFGTFKFTKDSHGNKYIRLKDALDPDTSWRWRYRVGASTSQLTFIYDTGEVGFKM